MDEIIQKFSGHLKNVLTRALILVVENKETVIEPNHLLWALSTQTGCVAAEILKKAGLKTEAFEQPEETTPSSKTSSFLIPPLSEEAKQIIEKAVLTANIFEHRFIGTEHLLSAILQTNPKSLHEIWLDQKVDLDLVQKNLATVFKTTSFFPELPDRQTLQSLLPDAESTLLDELGNETNDDSKTPALDYFTDELTETETAASFDSLIGREQETTRLMKILTRRTKNNPILVGQPGVGKTALVEGLAKQIVAGQVPAALKEKRIFRLDLASLIAGTMYRGEFESRLRQLVEEIREQPEAVLFIDEIHTISGAGATTGSLDAANILKPALARGEIRCIGSTTPEEYKKFIETDGALERRFKQIRVYEPSKTKTRQILAGILEYYENYHGVKYLPEAITAAVELSDRYLTDQQFPDKAIDLIDEAGAAAHLDQPPQSNSLAELKNQLEELQEKKQVAVAAEEFSEALKLKEAEEQINKKITRAKKQTASSARIKITALDILRVVADMTSIPLKSLSTSEQKKLQTLARRLSRNVIGQPAAVAAVSNAISRAKIGFQAPERPLASFLFTGPSGVGKTELAKTIAQEVFEQMDAFLQLDMSEYSAAFTVSKLTGAPAGYVGYRESNKLTDFVKLHPHAVILFDELEKAHPDVHNLLLQILEEGMITDATGRQVNFRNTIIVITSNEGSEFFDRGNLGFDHDLDATQNKRTESVREALVEKFRRELINRLDHVCVFERLDKTALRKIARKQLKELQARLLKQDIKLDLSPQVAGFIASQVDPKFGARDIRRNIEKCIEHKLAELILQSSSAARKHFVISAKKGPQTKLTIKTK